MSDSNIQIEALPDENNNLDLTVLNALLKSLTKETRDNSKALLDLKSFISKRERSNSESDSNDVQDSVHKKPRLSNINDQAGPSGCKSFTSRNVEPFNDDSDSSTDEEHEDSFVKNFFIDDSSS